MAKSRTARIARSASRSNEGHSWHTPRSHVGQSPLISVAAAKQIALATCSRIGSAGLVTMALIHRKRPAVDAYGPRAKCQIAHISYCITGPLGLLSSSSIGQWCPPGMETTMASKFTIFWVSESAQSSINLGSFDTREEAEAHIEGAWGEMRAQGNAQDLSWINAGALEIDEDSE